MEIWGWGANNYGQLGIGSKCEQIDKPMKISPPPGCIIDNNNFQIVGGGGHTLLTDSENKRLFAVGWNHKGQLGIENGFADIEKFQEVKFQIKEEVVQNNVIKKIACGWDFSVILYENGTTFVSGSNAFGQIGLGEEVKGVTLFVKLTALSDVNIVDISCGMRHSLFVDDKGNVYSTGCGKKGQLGLGDSVKKVFTPTLVNDFSSAVSVNCGQHFSVVIATSQTGCEMFTFGDNKYNQVSNTTKNIFSTPQLKLAYSLKDETLISADCGWTHVVILQTSSDNNKIFTWGRNTYGQLGSKNPCDDKGHTQVELDEQPLKVVSGYEHILVLTKSGRLYAWGWNEHSNCGVGASSQNFFQPQSVMIENKKVHDCFTGSAHSFALVQ